MTKLNLANLSKLNPSLEIPNYARKGLRAGILHIGVGNFHRAHQAVYLHRLFSHGKDHDWALIGGGIKPYDATMRAKLADQDYLTSVTDLAADGLRAVVTGVMIDFVAVEAQALIKRMAEPDIRIVSLTVTEGGYYVEASKGGFDINHPDIVAEQQRGLGGVSTVFGLIIAALLRRKAAGLKPFTVMSCDNLPHNGKVAKQAVIGLARLIAKDEVNWLEEAIAFPNSMVDCITPATTAREIALIKDNFGLEDAAPVVCEPFRQWVLEDKFSAGRPALESVGVEFVKDVAPYELMKLRILNGGHAAIAYIAGLLNIHYVHEAMAHPLVKSYLDALELREIIPLVPKIEGIDFRAYYHTIIERFSNPALGDTIPRLCLDGSNRQPKFILPAIEQGLREEAPLEGYALEVALWCRYCAGVGEAGEALRLDDAAAEELRKAALEARTNPQQFLNMRVIFGTLGENPRFRELFAKALASLWERGVVATVTDYCAG